MPRSRVPLVLLLVTAVALAAGCGSSSGSSSTNNSSIPISTTPASTPSSSTGGSVSGGSSFCSQGKADLKELKAQLAAAASISSTPARLKAQVQTVMNAFQKAEGEAPSQIQGDIATIATTMNKLNQILAAHNYDLVSSAAQAGAVIDGAQFKAASNHLQAWATANCGA